MARRRRDLLVGLMSTAGALFVIAALTSLRVVWYAHVVADVLLVAYLALLVHMARRTRERRIKVRHLPTAVAPRSASGITPLRRTASL